MPTTPRDRSTDLNCSTMPDWDRLRDRITRLPWATKINTELTTDTLRWRDQLVIAGPDEPSAWTHHYYCDDDGSKLVFDPTDPHHHRCPTCGRSYDDELRIGAWRTLQHNQAAAQVERDALIMITSDDPDAVAAARDELQSIMTGYGSRYAEYPQHGYHAGIGKVLPQSLDESIWAIGLLRATRWVDDQLDPQTRTAAEQLARGVAALLRPQVSMIHNIHCWMLGALAECAVRLGDDELLDFTCNSEFGAIAQLEQGFRAEGLWYEVNPHYHYYTLGALLSWLEAYGPDAAPQQALGILHRAISAPPKLAYSDGLLPAYGDGWPDTPVSRYAERAEAASTLLAATGEPIELAPYYRDGGPRDSIAALLYGPDDVGAGPNVASPKHERAESFCWPGSGIALLRSETARIVLRCGPDAGGHDHRDKLAIDVETTTGWRSLDLGTSGYGADFTNWMRSPAAHSTVFIGGQPQPHCSGSITDFSAQRAVGSVSWDGVRARREIILGSEEWTDTTEVDLDRADEISWILHGDGAILNTGTVLSANSGTATPEQLIGLDVERLSGLRRLEVTGNRLVVDWNAGGAPQAVIAVPAGFSCYAGEGEGNPSGKPLGTVIITGYAQSASITARLFL